MAKKLFKKGGTPWNKGKTMPTRKSVLPVNMLGWKNENHPRWKGDKVSYRTLHKWVERHLGKPEHCEHCGISKSPNGQKRYFNWANRTGKYLRDLTDWIRLCKKCHGAYDILLRRKN